MIESIRGVVAEVSGNRLLVEVGGLGYLVHATPSVLTGLTAGAPVSLRTALVVREDSWQLFGFGSSAERELFDLLQSVSGIGPKLALTILSAISAEELLGAIGRADEARLVRIPGVGKKSAARLIVELGDRLPKVLGGAVGWEAEVGAALGSLGWPDKDCDWAVAKVREQLGADTDSASALRLALAQLGQERRR